MLYLSLSPGGRYLNRQQVHTAILLVSLFVYYPGEVELEVGHENVFRVSPVDALLTIVTLVPIII